MDENTEENTVKSAAENGSGENRQADEHVKEARGEVKCSCAKWKDFLCVMTAAFLGGFLAVYFITDMAYHGQYKHCSAAPDIFERQMFRDLEKAFEHDFRRNVNPFKFPHKKHHDYKSLDSFSKEELNPFVLPDWVSDGAAIKTEINKDEYKVIVDLKAFKDDADKINYNVSGRKLTVFGSSKVKNDNYEQDISFSQEFLLPDNAQISKIKKKKEGDKAVIEIPLA